MEIVIPVVVAALAALGLVYPLVRPPLLAIDDGQGPWSELGGLEERKQAIYGAIRETSFDFRTDKIGESDYRREIETLKREAVGVVAQIEALRSQAPRAAKSLEDAISAAKDRISHPEGDALGGAMDDAMNAAPKPSESAPTDRFCTSCGGPTSPEDRFCAACGTGLIAT